MGELNSATDNPMVFTGDAELPDEAVLPEVTTVANDEALSGLNLEAAGADNEKQQMAEEIKKLRGMLQKGQHSQFKSEQSTYYRGPGGFVISGGNFHGEYPAKALDMLAIG